MHVATSTLTATAGAPSVRLSTMTNRLASVDGVTDESTEAMRARGGASSSSRFSNSSMADSGPSRSMSTPRLSFDTSPVRRSSVASR